MHLNRLFVISFFGLIIVICASTILGMQVYQQVSAAANPPIPVTGNPSFGSCGGPMISSINIQFEQAVVEQTNQVRMDNGLPPLKRSDQLDVSARYHAADMSSSNYFDHDTYGWKDGSLERVCDTWSRIEAYYTNWQALAENIAAGQRTPEMAMNGWMNSPEHRHNILSDAYSEIGVGFYEGTGEYRFYWDQNFGRRQGDYPLVIDGEKAQTSSADVPVYIYGSFDTIRFRNDQGQWSKWLPFQNTMTWKLPVAPGTHTVTAQMRGLDGSKTSTDSIELVP